MAGHSHAKNVQHRKNAGDLKRSKIFTKIQREIFVAAKLGGGDEKTNPRLRTIKQKARLSNMPNDKIVDAIKRATDQSLNSNDYEECYYMASLSGGAFILVKALTDNRNRTASEVKSIMTKGGANLVDASGRDFMFTNIGVIKYPVNACKFDDLFEKAIEFNAKAVENVREKDEAAEDEEIYADLIEVTCDLKDFGALRDALEEAFGEAKISGTEFRANDSIMLSGEQAEKAQRLIDNLEELDDVSVVYVNFKA